MSVEVFWLKLPHLGLLCSTQSNFLKVCMKLHKMFLSICYSAVDMMCMHLSPLNCATRYHISIIRWWSGRGLVRLFEWTPSKVIDTFFWNCCLNAPFFFSFKRSSMYCGWAWAMFIFIDRNLMIFYSSTLPEDDTLETPKTKAYHYVTL